MVIINDNLGRRWYLGGEFGWRDDNNDDTSTMRLGILMDDDIWTTTIMDDGIWTTRLGLQR